MRDRRRTVADCGRRIADAASEGEGCHERTRQRDGESEAPASTRRPGIDAPCNAPDQLVARLRPFMPQPSLDRSLFSAKPLHAYQSPHVVMTLGLPRAERVSYR